MDPFSAEGGQSFNSLSHPRPYFSDLDVPLFTAARPSGDVTYKIDIRILFAGICSIAYVWYATGLSWCLAIVATGDCVIVAMSIRKDESHDRSSSSSRRTFSSTWDFPLFAVVRPSGDITYNTDKRILLMSAFWIAAIWYYRGPHPNLAIMVAASFIFVVMSIRKDEGRDRYRRVERALRR